MSSRKKKKKSGRKKPGRQPRRAPRTLNMNLPPNTVVIDNPAGEARMSEVLLQFLEPYSEYWDDENQLRELIGLGVLAWNAAIIPIETREAFLREMMATVPPSAQNDLKTILTTLMQRKWTHFADNKRMIIDYQLSMLPSGPYLQVASSLPDSFTPGPDDLPR